MGAAQAAPAHAACMQAAAAQPASARRVRATRHTDENPLHTNTTTVDKHPPAAAPAHARTIVLDVGGMKCGGCSAAVKRMLTGHPGVAAAAVNLLTETAAVQLAADSEPALLGTQAAEMLTAKVRGADHADAGADLHKSICVAAQ